MKKEARVSCKGKKIQEKERYSNKIMASANRTIKKSHNSAETVIRKHSESLEAAVLQDIDNKNS